MTKEAIVQARVDKKLKRDAAKILDSVDVSMADAMRIYLRQIVLHKGLPLDVRIPNAETREAIAEARAGKTRRHTGSTKEVLQEILESDD